MRLVGILRAIGLLSNSVASEAVIAIVLILEPFFVSLCGVLSRVRAEAPLDLVFLLAALGAAFFVDAAAGGFIALEGFTAVTALGDFVVLRDRERSAVFLAAAFLAVDAGAALEGVFDRAISIIVLLCEPF